MDNRNTLYQSTDSSRSGESYNSRYRERSSSVDTEQLVQQPMVTQDGVRFLVMIEDTPFEFAITRQALEDLGGSRRVEDLGPLFFRNRNRIEAIARRLVEAGAKWPHLVIRMQDVLRHA